jgi:hypothetical protein
MAEADTCGTGRDLNRCEAPQASRHPRKNFEFVICAARSPHGITDRAFSSSR